MTFWAHSDPSGLPVDDPKAKWQPLSQHLVNVSSLSRRLAELADPGNRHFHDLASCCGLLHDFGKYTKCFQKMILTGTGRCQHAVHGAALAFLGPVEGCAAPMLTHVALAIAGHHAGLPDIKGGTSSLEERVKRHRREALELVPAAVQDSVELRELLEKLFPKPDKNVAPRFDLFTRMLFSCLIDADRLDSAGRSVLFKPLQAADLLQRLRDHVNNLAARKPEGSLKAAREQVQRDCLSAAEYPERLLSLSVPTGGGKTLAAMAFALQRATLKPEEYRRIIVVIPYLSIIEQNASVYAEVFGKDVVLEHHSGSFDRLEQKDCDHFVPTSDETAEESYSLPACRNATENWDAPLIVTTSVRFFESLFSNRPSDLRRVHNVARSVIVLDEVQTLPRNLLSPLLCMIRELADHWGCTFVFSTATQPAFQRQPGTGDGRRWEPGTIREIVREPERIRAALKRVEIAWEIQKPVSWTELAQRILAEQQALCVVNLRDHAGALFDQVRLLAAERRIDPSAVFHLSTRMCASHRLYALGVIRVRLQHRLPCWVISTQLVEAGVDLDFPLVLRALGPLDSIFQAAGRADREGRLTAELGHPGGRVVVFLPEDHRLPPNEYKEATGLTHALAKAVVGAGLQVDSVEAIQRYFERYYGEGADLGDELQEMRKKGQFAELAGKFEMISHRTRDVFVPYGQDAMNAIKELRGIGRLTSELRRKLQRYVVGLYPAEFEKARGVLEEIRPESEIWVAVERAYSESKGLKMQLEADDFFV